MWFFLTILTSEKYQAYNRNVVVYLCAQLHHARSGGDIRPVPKSVFLKERLKNINQADWGMNTDFTKAYEHILRVAKKHNVMKDSMPTMILVMSDMQFDESQNIYSGQFQTHYSHMEDEYEKAGYDFPKIVFWNLDTHFGTPAQCSDNSVAMVSGYSPSIMKAILNAEEFNPLSIMMEALEPIELNYINLPEEFSYVSEIR